MIYLFYGDDELAISHKITALIKEHDILKEDVHRYDASDGLNFEAVFEDASELPFFSAYKIVQVNGNPFKSLKESDITLIKTYFKNPSPFSDLIFNLKNDPLDKRLSITKFILSHAMFMEFELNKRISKGMIAETLKKNGQKIEDKALDYLFDVLKNDSWSFSNNLDILLTYKKDIDLKVAKEMVMAPLEEDIFSLTNAIFDSRIDRALKILTDFKKRGISAFYLISVLAAQFRFLNIVKILRFDEHYDVDTIASTLKAKPYRITMCLKNIAHLKNRDLLELLKDLSDLDKTIKTSNVFENYYYLEMYLLRLVYASN